MPTKWSNLQSGRYTCREDGCTKKDQEVHKTHLIMHAGFNCYLKCPCKVGGKCGKLIMVPGLVDEPFHRAEKRSNLIKHLRSQARKQKIGSWDALL